MIVDGWRVSAQEGKMKGNDFLGVKRPCCHLQYMRQHLQGDLLIATCSFLTD